MFERYTEIARRVIFFARYNASQFGSMSIESEHLLLGLLSQDSRLHKLLNDPTAAATIRTEVERRVAKKEKIPTNVDLPISNECKRILAYAANEAEELNHQMIGCEHLLLGILREEKCLAAEILSERGLKLETLRSEFGKPLEDSPQTAKELSTTNFVVGDYIKTLVHRLSHPTLPSRGVVPDADTARLIAQAAWKPVYGADALQAETPLQAEIKFDVWIVTGSASSNPLYAVILKADGRVISMGRGAEV
jgi:hypothetical protein